MSSRSIERNYLRAIQDIQDIDVRLGRFRTREAKRQLKVTWSGTTLKHCETPVYLGVTVDRTLSYKTHHIEKTRSKVSSRNNVLNKLEELDQTLLDQRPWPYVCPV